MCGEGAGVSGVLLGGDGGEGVVVVVFWERHTITWTQPSTSTAGRTERHTSTPWCSTIEVQEFHNTSMFLVTLVFEVVSLFDNLK